MSFPSSPGLRRNFASALNSNSGLRKPKIDRRHERKHFNSPIQMKIFLAFLNLALGILSTSAAQPRALSLHPDNPHYFLWRGKPTVLITAGEHYGAVLNLDFDYLTYLKEL